MRIHAPDMAAMDLFVVPTIGFDLLYAFVIVRLDRRDLVWINVTANPTAEWVARQITEAFPWDEAPRYLIRDRDRIYGSVVTRRLRAMGIRRVVMQEGSPSLAGWPPPFDHVLGNARLGDLKPELEQFAVNARRAPKRIFDAHPPDQRAGTDDREDV